MPKIRLEQITKIEIRRSRSEFTDLLLVSGDAGLIGTSREVELPRIRAGLSMELSKFDAGLDFIEASATGLDFVDLDFVDLEFAVLEFAVLEFAVLEFVDLEFVDLEGFVVFEVLEVLERFWPTLGRPLLFLDINSRSEILL
jgi:hypothetical protein